MNPFDYLSTLVSIILGLAVTHLLSNVYRLIHFRANVRFYWLPIIWAVLIFLGIVPWWWGLYGMRAVPFARHDPQHPIPFDPCGDPGCNVFLVHHSVAV